MGARNSLKLLVFSELLLDPIEEFGQTPQRLIATRDVQKVKNLGRFVNLFYKGKSTRVMLGNRRHSIGS